MSARNHNDVSRPTTLAGDISNVATAFTGADLTNYPASAFVITLDRNTASEEKVLVGTRTVNSVSGCTRGYGGTAAVAHSAGADFEHTMSAADLQEPNAHINNTALDHHTQYHNTARHAAVLHTTDMYADASITAPKLASGVITGLLPAAMPLGTLGYETNSSNQNGINETVVNVAGLSSTVTVGTNRRVKIEVELSAQADATDTIAVLEIKEGGNTLRKREFAMRQANHGVMCHMSVVLTPSAGAHTYKAAIRRSSVSNGNGTIQVVGTDDRNAHILIEDIGAA